MRVFAPVAMQRRGVLAALVTPLLLAVHSVALHLGREESAANSSFLLPTGKRNAIVTLVASRQWIEGARVLACSMRDIARENGVDMLAMCYHLNWEETRQVEASGWKCISPQQVQNPRSSKWIWDYTLKIAPFGMTQYDKVLIMDIDMVVLRPQNFIELFNMDFPMGNVMATRDCASQFLLKAFTQEDVDSMLQGGLMLIHPSNILHRDLLRMVPILKSSEEGGQGFVSLFFKGKVNWLPAKFNYIRASSCVHLINRRTGYYDLDDRRMILTSKSFGSQNTDGLVRDDIDNGKVVTAHFHFYPKPWECDPLRREKCGRNWDAGSTNILPIYDAWLEVQRQCTPLH